MKVLTSLCIGSLVFASGCPAEDPGGTGSTSGGSETSASATDTDPDETTEESGAPSCEALAESDPVPAACADLQVPPPSVDTRSVSAAFATADTVVASSHAAYACLVGPEPDDLACPCRNRVDHATLVFDTDTFEAGETTARMRWIETSLSDTCDKVYVPELGGDPRGWFDDYPVEILAVSDTCVIGEISGWLRFHADRNGCS